MEELAELIANLLAATTDEQRSAVLADVDLDETEQTVSRIGRQLAESEDPQALADATQMADAVDLIRAERDRRAEATAASQAQRDALAARFTTDASDAGDGGDATDPETGGPTDGGDTTSEPTAPTGEEDPEGDAGEPGPTQGQTQAAAVPSLNALRAFQPPETVPPPTEPQLVATAAADIPDFRAGSRLPAARDIAQAFISRRRVLGVSSAVQKERVRIAQFDYSDQLPTLPDDANMAGFALGDIARRTPAILASGGICAPAQRIWSFIKINRPVDLAQDFLPRVGADRGAIEFPVSPDIRDALALANLSNPYTVADDEASHAKHVVIVPCPDFDVCEIEAQYEIVKWGNIGSRTYPEWVEHWMGLTLDVHAHKVSRKLILGMVAASEPDVAVGPNGGATATVLHNVDLAAADYRHALGMPNDAPLDMVFPSWVRPLMRSDLATARKGGLETLSVTNAQVDQWLAARGVTPHYVRDWQDIAANPQVGAAVWPPAIDVLIYAPGTFVVLDQGVLNVGLVRDSVLNETNDYEMFAESFENVCKPGIESRVYQMTLCANGAFSADVDLNCNGMAESLS